MPANNAPIFTRLGLIGKGVILKTAATTDYTGVNIETREVFGGDDTTGAFIERLRFKSQGTNIQTVARIFLNRNGINTNWATAPAAPTFTPSASGGTILTGNYYARIVAIGPKSSQSVIGTASAVCAVTGPTGSIVWQWADIPGAVSYRIYIGPSATTQTRYFETATSDYTQTTMHENGINDDPLCGNNVLYGEITLPATTAVANAATQDIDYYMNLVLEPGVEVYVGLGTTVSAGWAITAIGGVY